MTVEAPRTIAFISVIATSPPEVIITVEKLLPGRFSVMALLPASRVVVPATARSIFCVISPFALILRVPPTTPSVLPSMSSSPFAFVSADV